MRTRAVALAWLITLAVTAAESTAQTSAPPAPPRAERIVIVDVPYAPYVGTTVPLSAKVWMVGQSEPATSPRVEWTSDNASAAWVTDAGTVVFVKPGKVTIKARSGSATAERAFEVVSNPARQLTLSDLTGKEVRVGDTVKVTALVIGKGDAAVTDARVNYGIVARRGQGRAPRASISPSGEFVAQDPGVYTVLAELAGFADRTRIRVVPSDGNIRPAPKRVATSDEEKVKFADIDYAPYVGTSLPIATMIHRKGSDPVLDTAVSWSVDAPDIASIADDGTITFLKPGKVTVTADDGVLQLTKKFTVRPNPSAKMVMVYKGGDIRVGDSVKVSVQIWARGGLPVKDARPNYAILAEGTHRPRASISEDGVFVAEEPGVYTIIAEIGGLADKTTIAVRAK